MNNYKVYRHISPSGKVYIGITKLKPELRWLNGKGYYQFNTLFKKAIKKYGWNNINHEILFDNLNEISAKLIECDLIYYYKKQNISYNITDGGDGIKGYKHSEETKQKISKALKGHKVSEETRKKMSEYKKNISQETKQKMSISRKGKKFTEQTKQKMSISQKGKHSKPIIKYDIKGNYIKEYKSLSDASIENKINIGNLSSALNGRYKTSGGYIWKYKIN